MFFIGHRDADERIKPTLKEVIQYHITECGVTEFVVGHYGGFDRVVLQCLHEIKQTCPIIKCWMLIPYHPGERKISIPAGVDGLWYPENMENVPKRLAIVRANRWMTDRAAYLISYVCHPASNAYNLLHYAHKREKNGKIHITNLGEK